MIESHALIATDPVAAAATALAAGPASPVSPCTVAATPLVVGYVGGYADGSRRCAILYAAAFVLGLALAFTGVGLAIALAGAMLLPAGGSVGLAQWVAGSCGAGQVNWLFTRLTGALLGGVYPYRPPQPKGNP